MAEARGLQVKIDGLVSRVLRGRGTIGLGSVRIKQRGQASDIPREANMRTSS